MAMPWLLVFMIVAEIISSISIAEAGYCYRSYACSYYGYSSQRYTSKCGMFYWQRCGRYRQIGVTHYRTCYQSYCCSGYTGTSCAQAVCYGSTSCPNGGSCASPDRCVCRPGFTGSKCSDLNECAAGTHNCQQICINNHGSFACSCKSGFLMNSDKKTCTDIDECLENNGGCSEFCHNTDGSYKCSCKNGLYLASDGKTCIDTDECSINNGGCEHQCINDYTTFRCACDQGYRIGLDGKSCIDIDECAGPNKCSQQCENTVGLYNCSCYQGFELAEDGVTCLDIDDCGNVTCLNGGSCIDLPNSYKCQCSQGYEGDYCQIDINECLFANGGCQDQCINTNGSFYCQCREDSFLEEDGFTCRGDSDVPSVFQKYQIARRLLPRGCMFVSLMSCKGGSETSLNLMLTSTDIWYRLNTNQSILYTYGIVFAEVDDISVPISLTGMNVISTGKNFDIVIGSLIYREEDGTALKDRHNHDCSMLSLTPKDIHDFVSSGSFLGTFFDRIQDKLPPWLRFSKSGVGLLSVTDLKTDLVYGQNIDSLQECVGAPVFEDRLYNVFRFGAEMSFSIYGDRVQMPAPLKGEKLCMIIDICHNTGGTIFLMIPENSKNLLDKADYFIALAKEGTRLRPKGIGVSLVNEIKVNYKTSELNLWSGEDMFRYRVPQAASVWMSTEVDYTISKANLDVEILANVDVYLKVPSIKNLLLDLFVEEWNGLVQFKKLRVIPTVKFKIGEFEVVLLFNIVLDSLEVFLSIGGDENRVFCGNNANPPGIFAKFLVNVNPFSNIPIIGEWMFDASSQVYALLTTDKKLSIETKTDIVKEITDLKEMLNKFRFVVDELYNKTIGELSADLQQTIIRFQSSVLELQTILDETTGSDSIRVILRDIKYLWEKYISLKNEANDLLDKLEFLISDMVKQFTELVSSEITRIGLNIDRAISKVKDQIMILVDSFTGVGFSFTASVKIFVLEFGILKVEVIHEVEGIGKCSKFKKVYELMSDVKATRAIAYIPIKLEIVRIRLGYFLVYDNNQYISVAVAMAEKRFVVHLHTHVSILGFKTSGDLLISNNGLYIHVEGIIWNTFFAQIEMSAELGQNWYDLTFKVKGSLLVSSKKQETVGRSTSDFHGSYLDGIRSVARKIGDDANRRLQAVQYGLSAAQRVLTLAQNKISQAQEKVKQCNAKFDSAIYSIENAKRKLDEAKAPYERALEKLRKAQRNINNLCRIKSCRPLCIPGLRCRRCGWFPCCKWTNCLIAIPNVVCHGANLICQGIRAAAYLVLEGAKLFVKLPMLAFDIAKAVLTGAQIVVDKARIVLDVAVAFLEVTKIGLQIAKIGLEVAKGAVELLKVTLSAALHVFDFLVLGIQQAIDVKNCGFEIEMSTQEKALFEIGCDVKAFGLGWKTFRFWFDFRNPITSMWRVAKGTIDAILDSITDIFGKRKRRDISFKAMSRLHHVFKIYKRDAFATAGNKTEYLANTVFETMYNHSPFNDILEYDYRVMLFQENCMSFNTIHSFLSSSIEQLLNMSNETVSQLHDMSTFSDPTVKITNETSIYDLTLESSGISAEYALKDYNLTYEELNAILEEVKSNFTDDSLITDVEEVNREAIEMTKSTIDEANSLSVVPFWIFELENMTAETFNRSDCANFRDCVLNSISILYDLFTDDSIENAVLNRQLTSSIEDILQLLLTNDSLTVTQTYLMSLELIGQLTSLNSSNMFCSTPPTFVTQPQNQTVLLGSHIHLLCNARGDPPPTIVWYFNDSMLENKEGAELTIDKAMNQNSGIYKCMAGNVVTNIISGDAFILAKECPPGTFFHTESCKVCPKGAYQRNWNQRECNICPTGFATPTKLSPSEMECTDINECTDQLSDCQQVCINTNGSYYCQCGRNYNLEKDGKTCSENNTELIIAAGVVVGVVTVIAAVVLIKLWKTRQLRKMKIRPSSGNVTISQPEQVDTDPANAKKSQTNT